MLAPMTAPAGRNLLFISLLTVCCNRTLAQAEDCRLEYVSPTAPVALENALVRLVVDPARGGTVSSYVLKHAQADLTSTWRDQPVGQGFGLCIDRLTTATRERIRDYETSCYRAEVVEERSTQVALRLTGVSPTGVGRQIQFTKVFRLKSGSTELVVDYEVANTGQSPVVASIWTCNHVRAGSPVDPLVYFYPASKGVRVELYTRAENPVNISVRDAPAAWCAALGERHGAGLAAAMEFATLDTLYTFMPGGTGEQDFPTLEWWTRRILLKPVKALEGEGWSSEPWRTQIRFLPLHGMRRVDGVAGGLAAAINDLGDGGQVSLSLVSAHERTLDLTVLTGPIGGPLTVASARQVQLPAGRSPATGLWAEVDAAEGTLVRVEARQEGELVLQCERPFGPAEKVAEYRAAAVGDKAPEPESDPQARLTRSFVTAHVKWATPLRGAPMKVLFVVRSSMQREVVELAQRLDLDYAVVPTQYSHYQDTTSNAGLMFYYPGYESMAELHKALDKGGWDAVCICSRYWRTIPEKTRSLLLERVKAGTALVNVRPHALTPDVRALFDGQPVAGGVSAICGNVPLAALPVLSEDPAGSKWVLPLEHGRGRIVLLRYPTTVLPDTRGDCTSLIPTQQSGPSVEWPAHEYAYALVARALLWAGHRLPADTLSLQLTGDAVPKVGAAPAVTVRVPSPAAGARLRWVAHWQSGLPCSAGTLPVVDGTSARIELPRLVRAEPLFLDVWLLDAGRIVDWGTIQLTVASPVTRVQVTASAPERASAFDVAAGVHVAVPIPDALLRLSVTDVYGRTVYTADRTVSLREGVNELKWPCTIPHPLCVRHRVRVEVVKDGVLLGSGVAVAYAAPRRDVPRFSFLVWEGGWTGHMGDVARQQMRGIGVTDYQINGRVLGRGKVTNASLKSRCDEILRNDMSVSLMNVNWVGGYAAPDNPLVRRYCLSDPAYVAEVQDAIRATLAGLGRFDVRTASTGDEISIGRYSGFNDFCQSPHTIRAFRQWLSGRYGTIELLNREWSTTYADFPAIPGITWSEVESLDNKAPWIEFRTFMEVALTEYLRLFGAEVKHQIPGVKAGFDGNTELCSYNGFDWWRISGVCDMITLYRTAAAEHFLGSFFRSRAVRPHFSMWHSTSRGRALAHSPWDLLLKGMSGVDYWYAPLLLNPDFTVNEYGEVLGAQVREIQRGIGTLILSSTRERDPIAILYSQASVHAATVESRRGRPGPKQINDGHFAWAELLADAGLTPEFVSYEQLAGAQWPELGYRVLVLPLCYALSAAEANQIERFVAGGGVLIADSRPGLYNGYGRCLQSPRLDPLFGVSRRADERPAVPGVQIDVPDTELSFQLPWSVADRDVELRDALAWGKAREQAATKPLEFGGMVIRSRRAAAQTLPAVIHARRGAGATFYLNLPIWRYREIRGTDRGGELARLFLAMAERGGVTPAVPVLCDGRPAPELSTTRFIWGGNRYVGLVKPMNARSRSHEATVQWPAAGYVYDLRSQQSLGRQASSRVTLSEERPLLLGWLPYEVAALQLTGPERAAPGEVVDLELRVEAGAASAAEHVIRCTVVAPDGRARDCYGANVIARKGRGTFVLPFAVNDSPGVWRVRASDTVSGQSAEYQITVGD